MQRHQQRWSFIQVLFVALPAHPRAHSNCWQWAELNWQFVVLMQLSSVQSRQCEWVLDWAVGITCICVWLWRVSGRKGFGKMCSEADTICCVTHTLVNISTDTKHHSDLSAITGALVFYFVISRGRKYSMSLFVCLSMPVGWHFLKTICPNLANFLCLFACCHGFVCL